MGHSMPTHYLFSRPISSILIRFGGLVDPLERLAHTKFQLIIIIIDEDTALQRFLKYVNFNSTNNQVIFKTVVLLERGDNFPSNDMLLNDLLRHLTFQRHFLRP